MCGKYYMNQRTLQLVMQSVDECEDIDDKEGDYTPGQKIPVVIYQNKKIKMTSMEWGYSVSFNSQRIINAKCETIFERKMFKNDIIHSRCLIPAQGFYEWDHLHHQISFEAHRVPLYMAGVYRQDLKEVVIITTHANQTMKPIHDRMPLMIHQDNMDQWLTNLDYVKEVIQQENEDLKIVAGQIQQSLF